MLSAVENFGGPLVGPAVALSHHHPHAVHHLQAQHHQHINTTTQHERGGIGYALDIIGAEGSVRVSAAAVVPTSATSVPTSTAAIISAQVPFTPNQLTQLNTLQALKLQQLQQQYEQQLSNFITASSVSSQSSTTIGGGVIVPLLHRPQPQVAATLSEEQQQQQQHHYNLQHQYQQQQEHQQQQQQLQREQQSNSVNLTLPPANAPKYMGSPRDTSAMMPLTEFTQPPKPKHEQQRTAKENGQCGAMNLVTSSSNTFPSTTNPYQLNSANSSNSNSASIDNSRPSSTSSSVDVENDESMSPVSTNGRKLFDPAALLPGNAALKQPTYSETSASSAAAAVVAAYQYNYAHLYGTSSAGGGRPVAGLYNAPVIFAAAAAHNPHLPHVVQHPSAVHGAAPPAAYLNALATHTAAISPSENGVYSAEYFKALQNAVAAGVFQTVPPTHTTPIFPISPLANSGSNNSNNSTPPSTITMPKTNLRSPATGSMSTQAPIASPPAKCEQRNATTTKLSTGTYLYEKAKRSPPNPPSDTEKFFKIPSGKEGSLKHRILTRPLSADKISTTAAVTAASTTSSSDSGKTPVMRTQNSTSSFKKGSYIELSNGSLRRVEDMRTEDFIQCAERSQHHQLIESTVVKINTTPSSPTVVIAFSYDRNHSKVDMEVATEYPFFVYGQGWASCNPELSYKTFGLKCQRLQVGDICISLTQREPPNIQINNNNNNISSSKNNNHNTTTYLQESTATTTHNNNETHSVERDLQPLILSESVYATHLKSAGMCPPPPTHPQYQLLRSPHGGTVHFMPPSTHLLANVPPTPEAYSHFVFPTPPQQHTQTSSTPTATTTTNLHNTRMQRSDLTSTPPTNTNSTRPTDACEQSATAAASARKRRWSAPESFSNSEDDDEGEAHTTDYQPPPVRQKSAPTAAVSSNYKPYLPATNMRLPASGQLYCDFSTNYK